MAAQSAALDDGPGPKLLEALVDRALGLARKARRQRRSLSGENYYANKLVELRADATNVFENMSAQSPGDVSAMAEMIEGAFSPATDHSRRLAIAKDLVFALRTTWRRSGVPEQTAPAASAFPLSILDSTKRGYLVSIGRQVNGCFACGYYDACAVMLRRLVELVIIELFEKRSIAGKIKGSDGNYLQLSDLISRTVAEKTWTLSRNAKKLLPSLRDIGHMSAHGRYFHAKREDVERLLGPARIVVEELLHIAGLL